MLKNYCFYIFVSKQKERGTKWNTLIWAEPD